MEEKLYAAINGLCTPESNDLVKLKGAASNQTPDTVPIVRRELSKTEKMSAMSVAVQLICSSQCVQVPYLTQELQCLISLLLQLCDSEEVQAVRTAADEGLCRIIKTYQTTHSSHIFSALFGHLKYTVATSHREDASVSREDGKATIPISTKIALRKFSQLCSNINISRRRYYAVQLTNILAKLLETDDEGIMETISKCITPIAKHVFSFANDAEMKMLMKCVLPKIHHESATIRRHVSEIVAPLCQHARRPSSLILWLWQTLLDIVIPVDSGERNSVSIHGVLLNLRALFIVIEQLHNQPYQSLSSLSSSSLSVSGQNSGISDTQRDSGISSVATTSEPSVNQAMEGDIPISRVNAAGKSAPPFSAVESRLGDPELWATTFQLVLHYCDSHENMIITAALECLFQLLRSLPSQLVQEWLTSPIANNSPVQDGLSLNLDVHSLSTSHIFKVDVKRSLSRGNSVSSSSAVGSSMQLPINISISGEYSAHPSECSDLGTASPTEPSGELSSSLPDEGREILRMRTGQNGGSFSTTGSFTEDWPLMSVGSVGGTPSDQDVSILNSSTGDSSTDEEEEDPRETSHQSTDSESDPYSSNPHSNLLSPDDRIPISTTPGRDTLCYFSQGDEVCMENKDFDNATLLEADVSESVSKDTMSHRQFLSGEDGDIGTFIASSTTHQRITSGMLYCARLLASRFLLSCAITRTADNDELKTPLAYQTPNFFGDKEAFSFRIVPDRLVRVSVKSLALACLTQVVHWAPHYLLQTLFCCSPVVKGSLAEKDADTASPEQQYLCDILLLWQHPDPQVCGQACLLLASFLRSVLTTSSFPTEECHAAASLLMQWKKEGKNLWQPYRLAEMKELLMIFNHLILEKDNGMVLKSVLQGIQMLTQSCRVTFLLDKNVEDAERPYIYMEEDRVTFHELWLQMLRNALRLQHHKYRLVKKQLLLLLGYIDYGYLTWAQLKVKHLRRFIDNHGNKIPFMDTLDESRSLQEACVSCLFHLLNDPDPEVRREAIVTSHHLCHRLYKPERHAQLKTWEESQLLEEFMQEAYSAGNVTDNVNYGSGAGSTSLWRVTDPYLVGPPIPGLHGALSLIDQWKHSAAQRDSRLMENVTYLIRMLLSKLSIFSLTGEDRRSLISCVSVLTSICHEFPPLYYARTWNLMPLNKILQLHGKHTDKKSRPQSPPSLCDVLLRRCYEWMTMTDLVLDLSFHKHLLQLYTSLIQAIGIQRLCTDMVIQSRQTEQTSSPEKGGLYLKPGTLLAQHVFQGIQHVTVILNILWHIVEDCPPAPAPVKMILPSLTVAGSTTGVATAKGPHQSNLPSIKKVPSSQPATLPSGASTTAPTSAVSRTQAHASAVANALKPKKEKDASGKDYRPASSKECWGYFYGNSHYQKLFEVLRDSFRSFLINPENFSQDFSSSHAQQGGDTTVLDLLNAALQCFGQLLEFARHFDVASHVTEVLAYLQTLYIWCPYGVVRCVSQLLRVLFGTNVSSLWDYDLAHFYAWRLDNSYEQQVSQKNNKSDESNSLQLITTTWDEEYYHMMNYHTMTVQTNLTQISLPENCPMGPTHQRMFPLFEWIRRTSHRRAPAMLRPGAVQFNAHKQNLSTFIRMFENIVFRSLRYFSVTSDQGFQEAIVDLLCQLIYLRVNYCTLDADQRFLTVVLAYIERLEYGHLSHTTNQNLKSLRLIPQVIHFLILLSYEKVKTVVNPDPASGNIRSENVVFTLSAVIRLCETLLANGLSAEHEVLPALVPLAVDLYVNRVISLTSANAVDTEILLADLDTQRECFLHFLTKPVVLSHCAAWDLLRLALQLSARSSIDMWKKWSQIIMESFWPSCPTTGTSNAAQSSVSIPVSPLRVTHWRSLLALRTLLSHLHQSTMLRLDSLLWNFFTFSYHLRVSHMNQNNTAQEATTLSSFLSQQYLILELILPWQRVDQSVGHNETVLLSAIYAVTMSIKNTLIGSIIDAVKQLPVENIFMSLVVQSTLILTRLLMRNMQSNQTVNPFMAGDSRSPDSLTMSNNNVSTNFLQRLLLCYVSWMLYVQRNEEKCPRLCQALNNQLFSSPSGEELQQIMSEIIHSSYSICLLPSLWERLLLLQTMTDDRRSLSLFSLSNSSTRFDGPLSNRCFQNIQMSLHCQKLVNAKTETLHQLLSSTNWTFYELVRLNNGNMTISELFVRIQRTSLLCQTFLEQCENLFVTKQHLLWMPRDFLRLLQCYESVHVSCTGFLLRHLITRFIISCPLLSVVQKAEQLARTHIDILLATAPFEKIVGFVSLSQLQECTSMLESYSNGGSTRFVLLIRSLQQLQHRIGFDGKAGELVTQFSGPNHFSEWMGKITSPNVSDPTWLCNLCTRVLLDTSIDSHIVADTLQYLSDLYDTPSTTVSSVNDSETRQPLVRVWFESNCPFNSSSDAMKNTSVIFRSYRRWCHVLLHCLQVGCERTQAMFHPVAGMSSNKDMGFQSIGPSLSPSDNVREGNSGVQTFAPKVDTLFTESSKALLKFRQHFLSQIVDEDCLDENGLSQSVFCNIDAISVWDSLCCAILSYHTLVEELPLPMVWDVENHQQENDSSQGNIFSLAYSTSQPFSLGMNLCVAWKGLCVLYNVALQSRDKGTRNTLLIGQYILRLTSRCLRESLACNEWKRVSTEEDIDPSLRSYLRLVSLLITRLVKLLWNFLHIYTDFPQCPIRTKSIQNHNSTLESTDKNDWLPSENVEWRINEMLRCILSSDCVHDQPWNTRFLLKVLITEVARHPLFFEKMCNMELHSPNGGMFHEDVTRRRRDTLNSRNAAVSLSGIDLNSLALLDRDRVASFVSRLSLMGWTLRHQFEELWTSYLALLNHNSYSSLLNEGEETDVAGGGGQTQASSNEELIERTHSLCSSLRGLSHLLLHTVSKPWSGNVLQSHLEHRPRDALPSFLHTRLGRKLGTVHNMIEEELQRVLYGNGATTAMGRDCDLLSSLSSVMMDTGWNLEREMRLWSKNCATLYEHSLVSISLIAKRLEVSTSQWNQSGMLFRPMDNITTSNDSGPYPLSSTSHHSSKLSHVDSLSCLQSLPMVLSEWLTEESNNGHPAPLLLRLEVVRLAVMVSDLFTVREQMEWLRQELLQIAGKAFGQSPVLTQVVGSHTSSSSTLSSASHSSGTATSSSLMDSGDPYLLAWLCLGLAKCNSVLEASGSSSFSSGGGGSNDPNSSSNFQDVSSNSTSLVCRWISSILQWRSPVGTSGLSTSLTGSTTGGSVFVESPGLHCAALQASMLLLQTDRHISTNVLGVDYVRSGNISTTATQQKEATELNAMHHQVLRYLEQSLERMLALCVPNISVTSQSQVNPNTSGQGPHPTPTNISTDTQASSPSQSSPSSSLSVVAGIGGSLRRTVISTIASTASHVISSKVPLENAPVNTNLSGGSSNVDSYNTTQGEFFNVSSLFTATTAGHRRTGSYGDPNANSATPLQTMVCAAMSAPHTVVERYQLTLLATAFFYCERYPDALRETDLFSNLMRLSREYLGAQLGESESGFTGGQYSFLCNPAVYVLLCRGLERLILAGRLPKMAIDVLYKLAVDQLRSPGVLSPHRSIPILGLFLTCAYSHAATVLANSSPVSPVTTLDGTVDLNDGGMFSSDPEAQLLALERVSRLFERLQPRRSSSTPFTCATPSEANLLVRILPSILLDFFPPTKVINKVLAEFLSTSTASPTTLSNDGNNHGGDQSPALVNTVQTAISCHPNYMARLLFEVLQRLIIQGCGSVVLEWVLMSLCASMTQEPLSRAVWSTTTLLLTICSERSLIAVFPSHIERGSGLLEKWDVELLCAAGVHVNTCVVPCLIQDETRRRSLLTCVRDYMEEKAPFIALHNALLRSSPSSI